MYTVLFQHIGASNFKHYISQKPTSNFRLESVSPIDVFDLYPTESLTGMLRRKPTRLELKLDDMEEFESVKKELESRKKQRDEVDVVGVPTSSEMSGASGGGEGKTREQMIHERIGYKPHPKPNTLPSLFGNLQF
ncbi:hypothetical protein SRHO_G00290310 [Serrasalmus rhombeus]